jgi:molybdate transport system substrate-binding protein
MECVSFSRLASCSPIQWSSDMHRLSALIFGLIIAPSNYAAAADITFMCAEAMQSAIDELIPEFRKMTGHAVYIEYANIGTIAGSLRQGKDADLAIASPQQWESLRKEGRIVSDVHRDVAKVGAGVFVQKGAARPEINSVDAFKRAILNARSIAFRDPNQGSPVGTRILALFDRLGISAEIRPKLLLTVGRPYKEVINGHAEIGFSTLTGIVAAPEGEVGLVGPIPTELQDFIVYSAAVPTVAKEPVAARALLEFLTSARAVAVFGSKGFEP